MICVHELLTSIKIVQHSWTVIQFSDFQVIRSEVLFTGFLVEHNLPMSVADHAGPLFKQMFPDSAVASQYRRAR